MTFVNITNTHVRETSPVKQYQLSTLSPPNLLLAIPSSYRASTLFAALPSQTALILGFCTSGQMFAADFFQIPPRDGHPCLSGYAVPTTWSARDLHPLAGTHAGQTKSLKSLFLRL